VPIQCDEYDRVAVLSVEGDFDGEQLGAAREAVRAMLDDRQVIDFVADLSRCPFVSSEGLELLLWLKRRAEEMLGRVKLAACDENVMKILEMTRLRSRFECIPSVEAAVRQMRA
jgi:anti-anti-sigma factor